MKVLLSMVVTADGLIARPDGSEEYSSHANWEEFVDLAKECSNFVIGRKTYDITSSNYEGFGFDQVECDYKVILSRAPDLQLGPAYLQATSPEDALRQLKGKVDTVLLTGGAEINAAFAKAGLIDEVALTVEPHLIGKGIRLFGGDDFDLKLTLKSIDTLSGGRLRISYMRRR